MGIRSFEERQYPPCFLLACMTTSKFKYRGFGLNIGSEIEFPELYPSDFDFEDVRIDAGPIKDHWFEGVDTTRVFQRVEPGLFRLQIPGEGRYLVTNGTRIQIEPRASSASTAFRMYVLTVAFSACLLQRNQTLLHASGIIISDSVFLFAGASGAGKSTLLARLMQRGHQVFSDDVCVFNGHRDKFGRWLAAATYPILKIHEEGLVNFFPESPRNKIWPDAEKFGISFHHHFFPEPLPVAGIALITKGDQIRQIEMETLVGLRAFEALAGCTYRPAFMQTIVQQQAHAKVISGLANGIPVYQFQRPVEAEDAGELASRVEGLMRKNERGLS